MKKGNVFYLFMIFLLCSCKNYSKKENFISITSDYGDHEYTTVVSYNDSLIQVAIDSNQIYENKGIANELITHKIIVSENAFKMLSDYFKNNCQDFTDTVDPYPVYTIKVGKMQGKCYVSSDNKEAKNKYFSNLISLIESSKYKNECKDLIENFRYIISQ